MTSSLKKGPVIVIAEVESSPRPCTKLGTPKDASSIISEAQPTSAFHWPLRKKWTVTFLSIFVTFTSMLNGTIITVAHEPIDVQFHLNNAVIPQSYWLVSSWTLGGAVSCLIILPLLEDFGIRTGVLATYAAFIVFMIPQALTPSFAIMLMFRFLTGGCVSILANSAACVIDNVWDGDRARTVPMSLWVTLYMTGISFGPVLGAALLNHMDWRWLIYVQIICHSVFLPFYWFFFEESRESVIVKKETEAASPKSIERKALAIKTLRTISQSVKRPLHMVVTEPVLCAFTLWISFAIGLIYLFTQSVEQVYSELHGWTPIQAGYVQAAVVIGTLFGWSGTMVSRYVYFRSARHNLEHPGSPIPEARLYVGVAASVLAIAAGMFVYGWTARPGVAWIWSAIGLALVGFGSCVVVTGAADYVVDAYASYAGSAIAAVVLGENLVAAFLPLASETMYSKLGFEWASTTLGFAVLALSLAPVALIIWGPRIRACSQFIRQSMADAELLDAQRRTQLQVECGLA